MNSFKLVSKHGDFLPLLARMEDNVLAYVEGSKDIYDGIVPRVDSELALDISQGDIVIFDMVGGGNGADALKSKGYTVIGGGHLNDNIELHRDSGQDFMKMAGIPIPPTANFAGDYERARWFVEKTKKAYVFKPNENLGTSLTYVSSSAENMLAMLPYLEDECPDDVNFQLQEVVHGIEMSTEAWFNGNKFLLPINSTMEEKKFMAGNLGPNTGCMGNIVWFWSEEVSRYLYKILFEPLEEELERSGYLGPLDVNAIWTPKGPLGLEWTARFGYDALQAMTRLLTVPLSEFFSELQYYDRLPVEDNPELYSLTIRGTIPPYPSDGDVPNIPILGIKEEFEDNIYLSDVKHNGKGLVCAGTDGYILVVGEHGPNIQKLKNKCLYILDQLEIAGLQYRIDIGDRVMSEKRKIESIISALILT